MELEDVGGEPGGSHFLSPDNPHTKRDRSKSTGGACVVAECDSPIRARGLCNMHWRRYSKHGSTDARPPKRIPPGERFWAKVDKSTECWTWIGAVLKPSGYGAFGILGSKTTLAHRFAWEEANGPIPTGMVIDHICRQRTCVNPGHLRMVTQKQNLENHGGPGPLNTSGVRGVSRKNGRWLGQVTSNYVHYRTGTFATIAEAEAAVIELRNRLHTHNDADRQAVTS